MVITDRNIRGFGNCEESFLDFADYEKIKELKKKLRQTEKAFRNYEKMYKMALIELQCMCPHEKIVEGDYVDEGIHSKAMAPFRVCVECGYAEQGWGSGYALLNKPRKDVGIVERGKAHKYVKTLTNHEEQSDIRLGKRTQKQILETRLN